MDPDPPTGEQDQRPLLGRTVVVTRPARQAGALVASLRGLGAVPVEVPAIEVAAPADGGAALHRAAAVLATYDWVALTSVNGVERLFALVEEAPSLGSTRVAAIGPGTAGALARRGVVADLVPRRFVAESLVDAFPPAPPGRGGRVLLPRAASARDTLPAGLAAKGWQVEVVEAYRTVTAAPAAGALERARSADAVTFTSPSTVAGYLELAGPGAVPALVACIGPVTAAAARAHGLRVAVEAETHTVGGLVEALTRALGGPPS